MPDAADPPSGRVGPDGVHRYPIRVYLEDTDSTGVVYHANYLRYLERARTEMMRALGLPHARMMAESHVAFAVRHCAIDYRRPARLDDALEVATFVVDTGAATVVLSQSVYPSGGLRGTADLVQASLRLACLNQMGRPARLPGAVRDMLLRLQAAAANSRQPDES